MPSRLASLIRRLLRRALQHEEDAVAAQRRVLRDTRTDVLRTLAALPTTSYRAAQLGMVLDAIDRALDPKQAESVRLGGDSAREAYAIGRAQAAATMPSEVLFRPQVGLTTNLVQAVVDVTEDQLRSVWGELGSGLKASVRRTALGAQDLDTAISQVQRMVRDPKTFKSAEARAEVVVRTEVNRTYSVAADARFRELDGLFDGELRKAWITTADSRTRPAHRQAGITYAVDGQNPGPIPISASFIVGGDRLRFPLDPMAPARAVIQCRCRMVAVPPTVTAAEWVAFSEEFNDGEQAAQVTA